MSHATSSTKRLPVPLLAILFALAVVFAFMQASLALAAGEQERWSAFAERVQAGGDVELVLDEDLTAVSQITIPNGANVVIKGSGTIYREAGNADFPVFKVENGATLTIEGNVTLSGKSVKCNTEPADPSEGNKPNNHRLEDYAKTDPAGNQKASFKFTTGQLSGHDITYYLYFSGNHLSYNTSECNIDIDSEGYVKLGDYYLGFDNNDYYATQYIEKSKAVRLQTSGGGDVSTVSSGSTYYLYDPVNNGYLYYDSNYFGFSSKSSSSEADALEAVTVTPAGSGATYWMIPTKKPIDQDSSKERFDTEAAARAALKTLNEEIDPIPFWYVPDADPTVEANRYYDKDDPELKTKMDAYNRAHQGCDGTTSACTKYTINDFKPGAADAPRGFFIEVGAGGTAKLDGNATLTNFTTGPAVNFVSPVLVSGANATFNMTGNSKITKNSVGYTANNVKSTDGTSVTTIKNNIRAGEGTTGQTWSMSNTAGAILYANGAKGTINGKAQVTDNRGDTGAIVVTGGASTDNGAAKASAQSTLTIDGNAQIDRNAGVHYAGGLYAYNGGAVMMAGGQMDSNFAWFRGGAVYVADEKWGVRAKDPTPARLALSTFTLDGGKLTNNHALDYGGAMQINSDGVALLSGEITGNTSRVLGGAIYVAGDKEDHMFRLYVERGCISENYAVKADDGTAGKNDLINQGLAPNDINQPTCNFDNALQGGASSVDTFDFAGYQGRGGGLWLCAMGGNATFDLTEDKDVVIGSNFASVHAQDINLRPSRPNAGSTINILNDTGSGSTTKWINEDTQEPIEYNKVYSGPLRINAGEADWPKNDGVLIKDNASRNGGAIAANGTVIFGNTNNVNRISATLDITKAWGDGVESEPVTLKIQIAVPDGEGNYQTIEGAETITLDGQVDDDAENDVIYEKAPWVAGLGVPVAVTDANGKLVPLFTINGLDPSKYENLQAIHDAVENDPKSIEVADWQLVIEEIAPDAGKYIVSSSDVVVAQAVNEPQDTVKYYDKTGKQVGSTSVVLTTIGFAQTVTNEIEHPEIEKFVNQKVHESIVLEDTFTYDILAYVTKDAELVEITDTLKPVLQFASAKKDVSVKALPADAIDHTPQSKSWAEAGTDVKEAQVSIDPETRTLTVAINPATNYRGQWIKVTFDAKIADGLTVADIEGSYKTITDGELYKDDDSIYGEGENRPDPNLDNQPVASQETHTGVPNTASYRIQVDNDWRYRDESNTVTVKPIVIKISKTDLDGVEIAGATIKVTDSKGELIDEWESTGKAHELVLKPGDYEMTEVVAPDGYQTITTIIKFTVNEDGTVTVNNATEIDGGGNIKVMDGDHIMLADAPIKDTPEIEKYINQDVHQGLASIDEVFTYDIIAYATADATKLTITDELVKNLEYVSKDADVKVVDLGTVNNHKTNGTYTGANADATVAAEGKAIDADVKIDGKKLTVVVDNVKDQDLRGHYVKVTVQAKVTTDDGYVTIDDNGTVLSELSHEGIPNTAAYTIDTARGPNSYGEIESNTVTVKPEKPTIEKYVNQDVHQEVEPGEAFTYDIIAYATTDATKLTIADELVKNLEYVSAPADVKVVDLGTVNNHKTNGTYTGANADATVAAEGKAIEADVKIDGKKLTVVVDKVKDQGLRGHYIKVTIQAKITTDDGYVTIDDNGTVASDLAHEGIPNKAAYIIDTDRGPNTYGETESNTVTVKEKGKPQIEKYVNKDVHKDIEIDEVFPYDVIVYVPKDADTIQIRDVLNDQLTFADDAETIAATAVVKEANNHTVRGTVSSTDGTAIAATAAIDGQTLLVDIADATAARGKYIQITFNARVADGLTVDDLVFETITDNGDVLGGADTHTGVPNTAEYRIGIKNGADVDYSKYAPEDNPEGWNESNTVTVKPVKKFDVVISKQDITSSNELPGAEIKVTDENGTQIDKWVSGNEPRTLRLAPGRYTLEEVNAPEGYQSITTVITFDVDENGNVTLVGAYEDINGAIAVQDVNHLVLSDLPNKYIGSDTTEAGAATVHKAWFDDNTGFDPTRTPVTFQAQYSIDGGATWTDYAGKTLQVTGETVGTDGLWYAVFDKLPMIIDGKDALWRAVEIGSPAGYIAASGGASSVAGANGMTAKNLVDDGTDTPKAGVTISKQAVGGGAELPGARIQVIDAKGNVVEEFVSGTTPHRFTLPAGTYTLREITAPNGYEVAEDMTFRVNEDGTVECLQNGKWVDATDHVVMYDAPKTNGGGKGKNVNPKTPTPSTTKKGATVRTGDMLGGMALGIVGLALLGAGAAAMARRRSQR